MEEAPVVVTMATGAIGPVVAKLSTLLVHREYKLRRRTRKDVKLIRSKLKSIHSLLWVIRERDDLDVESKELRREAWDLADDMDDEIDDFILRMKRRNDGRFIQDKILQPSLPFQDLKTRAEDVSKRCRNKWEPLFSREKAIVDAGNARKPRLHTFVRNLEEGLKLGLNIMLTVGDRHGIWVDIMEHLTGAEESKPVQPQLKMASIVGSAGVGKTTFAHSVYKAIDDQFEARAFVSVTENHNITQVLASILQQVMVQKDASGLATEFSDRSLSRESPLDPQENYLSSSPLASLPASGLASGSSDMSLSCESTLGLQENYLSSGLLASPPASGLVSGSSDRSLSRESPLGLQENYLSLGPLASPPASLLAPHVGSEANTQKHLIDIISNFLRDKMYLVIVDDIWNWGEWETIKKSLPDNNLGSRIVTSSRLINIAMRWRDNFDALVCEIDFLDNGLVTHMLEAMKPDMIGEDFDCHHGIVTICGGMPLALICMLSALAKERERQEQQGMCPEARDVQDMIWKQVMQIGIQNTPGFEPLVESLQLGYNNLPHHMLKTCLLYCSIYPERYKFERDHIVRRWISQGFVCKEGAANYYCDELVSRGIFIEFREDMISPVSSYTMNPMMRNYIRWKLGEDNFFTCSSDVPSSGFGRRLCIDYWPSNDSTGQVDPLSGIDWCHIRLLVNSKGGKRIPYNDLQHLRLLDFHQVEEVDALENQDLKDMCGLHRLRHLLGLCGNGITEIPAEIARLRHLETLELSYTGITRLPTEIGDLIQLKTLDVSLNTGLTELPREMVNLKDLETLRIKHTNVREPWEIITRLKKLKTLDVSRNEGITELPKEIGKLQHLEILNIEGTGITKLPRDIGKLQNLVTLDLSDTNVRKVPREIGGLKKLEKFGGIFTALPFEAGQISGLLGLPRCVKQAWKNSHLVSSVLAREILSFEQTNDGLTNGGLILGTKHMHVPRWIAVHFNDVGSLDISICKLEEQDLKMLREMPRLEFLFLRFEAVPRKPVTISSEGFAKLRVLVVDSRVPQVTFLEGAMPSLRRLKFEFQFYAGPQNTDPMGITHLVSLGCVTFQCNEWYRGDSACISGTINAVRKEAQEHPNSKTPDAWGIIFEVSTNGQEDVTYYSCSQNGSDDERDVACSSGKDDEIVSSSDANTTSEFRSLSEGSLSQTSQDDSDVACSDEVDEIEEIQA